MARARAFAAELLGFLAPSPLATGEALNLGLRRGGYVYVSDAGVSMVELTPSEPVVLRVEASGFPDQQFPFTPGSTGEALNLGLRRGGYVYVSVRGDGGRPGCADLRVVSRDSGFEAQLSEFAPGSYGGRVLPGDWELQAENDGERSPRTTVTVAEGSTTEVRLEMSR